VWHETTEKKRRHPESNGDAPKGPGLKPGAIPLCDDGIEIPSILYLKTLHF
jgi:hypothetical protein